MTGSQGASTQPGLSRALSLGGAAGISTGLAFAAINFLGMAQLLAYISGPVSWIAVLGAGVLVLGVRGLFCELNGMFLPLPVTKKQARAAGDPRPSLQELYKSHQGYVRAVERFVRRSVRERFLLPEDAVAAVRDAEASDVLVGVGH